MREYKKSLFSPCFDYQIGCYRRPSFPCPCFVEALRQVPRPRAFAALCPFLLLIVVVEYSVAFPLERSSRVSTKTQQSQIQVSQTKQLEPLPQRQPLFVQQNFQHLHLFQQLQETQISLSPGNRDPPPTGVLYNDSTDSSGRAWVSTTSLYTLGKNTQKLKVPALLVLVSHSLERCVRPLERLGPRLALMERRPRTVGRRERGSPPKVPSPSQDSHVE